MEEISLQYPGSVLGHFEWTMWEMSTKTHRKFWTYTPKQWIFQKYIYHYIYIYMYTFTWSIHLCNIIYINHSFFHYAKQSPADLLRRPHAVEPQVKLSKVPMDAILDRICTTCCELDLADNCHHGVCFSGICLAICDLLLGECLLWACENLYWDAWFRALVHSHLILWTINCSTGR